MGGLGEPFGELLGGSWRVLEASWRLWEASWRHLGANFKLKAPLEGLEGPLGRSWRLLGGVLEASWAVFGGPGGLLEGS